MLSKLIFSWFLTWSPLVVSGAIILIILINNLWPNLKFLKKVNTKKLIYIWLGFTVFFDFLLSVLQYFTWKSSAMGHFFLPPFTSINYFLRYSFFHFWLANLISFVCAFGLYFIFKLLQKYRAEIISQNELLLILLSSLLVAWPKIIIFVPVFFLMTLVFTLINLVVYKKSENSLIWPLIFSLIITFLAGSYLINLLSLSTLII